MPMELVKTKTEEQKACCAMFACKGCGAKAPVANTTYQSEVTGKFGRYVMWCLKCNDWKPFDTVSVPLEEMLHG